MVDRERRDEREAGDQEQQAAGEREAVAGAQARGDEAERRQYEQDPAGELVAQLLDRGHGRIRDWDG